MGFYDFACADCGNVFEIWTPGFIDADDEQECPACGSTNVQQKFTSFLRGGSASGGCAAPSGSPFG